MAEPASEKEARPPGQDQFNWVQFWREMLYHTLFPLSYPALVAWESPHGAFNRGLGIGNPASLTQRLFWTQTCLQACVVFVNVAVWAGLTSREGVSTAEVVHLDFLFLAWCGVVSVKYGYFHKCDLADLRARVLPAQEFAHLLVLTAWAEPSAQVVQREISRAAHRTHVDLATSRVFVDLNIPGAVATLRRVAECAHREGLCDKPLPDDPMDVLPLLDESEGNVARFMALRLLPVSTARLVAGLVAVHADKGSRARVVRVAGVLAVFLAACPAIVRLATGQFVVEVGALDALAIVATFVATTQYALRTFVFALLCLVDARRRYWCMHSAGELLSASQARSRVHGRIGSEITPLLDVTQPESVLGWLDVRRILHDFGSWYHARLRAYVICLVVLVVAMVVLLFAELTLRQGEDADHLLDGRTLVWMVMVVTLVVLQTSLVLRVVYYGAAINTESVTHRYFLLKAQMVLADSMHEENLLLHATTKADNADIHVLASANKPELRRGGTFSNDVRTNFGGTRGCDLTPEEIEEWLPLPRAEDFDSHKLLVAVQAVKWARTVVPTLKRKGAPIRLSTHPGWDGEGGGGGHGGGGGGGGDGAGDGDGERERQEGEKAAGLPAQARQLVIRRAVMLSLTQGRAHFRGVWEQAVRDRIARLQESMSLLRCADENLRYHDHINPAKFLGFRASEALTNAILTFVATVAVVFLNVFFGADL